MVKKKALKTTLKAKEVSPAVVGTETTLAARKKQDENKEGLRVDPTITQEGTKESEEVNEKAMQEKLAAEAEVQEKVNAMKAPVQINAKEVVKVPVKEPKALKASVQKDAEARKKTYQECPITGVLVVR